ncbi:unnamed protein product [Citrullus colocynthis]|uniref:Uncharacterized protein n=1 Tax=Citrullus colocynthis TaxID=252529 RepID=A0ABP0XTH9_9ROSI
MSFINISYLFTTFGHVGSFIYFPLQLIFLKEGEGTQANWNKLIFCFDSVEVVALLFLALDILFLAAAYPPVEAKLNCPA